MLNKEDVKTLSQLVDFINERESWSLEVEEIIANNGWCGDCGEYDGVCHDGTDRVIINEQGFAELI